MAHTGRLQVYERVGISFVEVYERVGKTVISVGKRAQKGLADALHGCEKSGVNGLVLRFIHILKTVLKF